MPRLLQGCEGRFVSIRLLLIIFCFGLPAPWALGDETDVTPDFDVTRYVQATLARLQLVRDAVADTGSPPSAAAQAALLAQYGIESQDYYLDASRYAVHISAYLENHASDRTRIENLSEEIKTLVSDASD